MNLFLTIGASAAAVSAIIGAVYLLHRAVKSMQTVSVSMISAAVDSSRTGHLVDYHLGPNDGTPPLHERVRSLETELAEHRQTEPGH